MAAVVINHILGGGVFSARLFREVREKRGLAYSVYSHLSTFDHAAIFGGGTSTKNERAKESMEVIQDQIGQLAAEGPTEEELDKAKKFLTGSYALRFDTSLKIASQLVNLQTENFDVTYLDERNAMIDAVTLEDARRVAGRMLGSRARCSSLLTRGSAGGCSEARSSCHPGRVPKARRSRSSRRYAGAIAISRSAHPGPSAVVGER